MKKELLVIFLFIFLFTENLFVWGVEKVTFYPTYGYKKGMSWIIPMRVWVHEDRDLSESVIAKMAGSTGNLTDKEKSNFRSRITDFVADDESREEVIFVFDKDPDHEPYCIKGRKGKCQKTDLNGLIEGSITLSEAKAQKLLSSQSSEGRWLTYQAVSRGHRGTGRVILLEATGLSIISDIDDTIKVTEIPAGKRIAFSNTFFRDFVAVPGMTDRYRRFNEASFHYVSGGPWQMYGPLSEFLIGKEGFPEGTFHMKNMRKNLLITDTWEDLWELVTGGPGAREATLKQKVSQISKLMTRFPGRKFILIGDSGEGDPEVFDRIRDTFPDQVQEIWVRDVINDREKNRARLKGMEIIPAPTIIPGVSQFDTN